MKTKIHIIISCLVVLFFAGQLVGCKSGSEENDPVLQMLTSGTWKGASIEMDGQDKSSLFAGFQLTFTATAFTSVNGLGIWPEQGTWSFVDETKTSIKRSDSAVIAISSISADQLVLTFSWDPAFASGGRTRSVAGEYVFHLRK